MQLVGDLDLQLILDHQFFLFCGGLKPVYSSASCTEFLLFAERAGGIILLAIAGRLARPDS